MHKSKSESSIVREVASKIRNESTDVPLAKLVKALLAISLGTVIEWYDFTIVSQLNKYLTAAFFPSKDPVVQALSFWGVYAVGYVSRPVGAVVFGHIGDTRGRGMCLLLSVLLMGIPTVLIGCLPTYATIGIAAPAILAILRLIQGLAMGGEFGAAMVYLHEIAIPKYRSVTGSLGYISLGIGVVVGILMVTLMVGVVPEDALLVWGWRLPFLVSIFTLLAAVVLRYNMPESSEFIQSREEIDEEYQQRLEAQVKAAIKNRNRSFSRSFKSLRRSDTPQDLAVAMDTEAATAPSEAEAPAAPQAAKHYVPLAELFRNHWSGILLQMGYEAWVAASFYTAYSWLPSFFQKRVGLSVQLTLWMVLVSMVVFTCVVPIAGYLSDRGMPRVKASLWTFALGGATAVPMFLGFGTHSLAACWLLQIFSLSLTAFTMGLLPCICANIFPAGVRISGFNLGYNLGMTVFGGMTPLIITAIQSNNASLMYTGPGLWLVAMAVVSILCSLLLLRVMPHTDITPPEDLAEQEAARAAAKEDDTKEGAI